MIQIRTAILLAAGHGSRLRDAAPLKPLCPVAGRPLIDHALSGLAAAGIERVVVVLGYRAEEVQTHLASGTPVRVETVINPAHEAPNGVSVLAARECVDGEALLAMCDHLADPALYRRVAEAGAGNGVRLGIDRWLDNPAVDLADVTRVRTAADRIVAIGKEIAPFDCYDTGVFAIGPALFEALDAVDTPSLTDGVSRLAEAKRAHIMDCTGLNWIDVDDPTALALAERKMRAAGL